MYVHTNIALSINFQGEKVFYFVEPTEENFNQYEKWVSSARQSEVFFGDMAKQCYKCAVKPGQTLLIPTGTTNAVFSIGFEVDTGSQEGQLAEAKCAQTALLKLRI